MHGRRATEAVAAGGARGAFIRDQTILGFTVYGPSFAYAVTNETAGRLATYLIVAGGSFFGASTLSRDIHELGLARVATPAPAGGDYLAYGDAQTVALRAALPTGRIEAPIGRDGTVQVTIDPREHGGVGRVVDGELRAARGRLEQQRDAEAGQRKLAEQSLH